MWQFQYLAVDWLPLVHLPHFNLHTTILGLKYRFLIRKWMPFISIRQLIFSYGIKHDLLYYIHNLKNIEGSTMTNNISYVAL